MASSFLSALSETLAKSVELLDVKEVTGVLVSGDPSRVTKLMDTNAGGSEREKRQIRDLSVQL